MIIINIKNKKKIKKLKINLINNMGMIGFRKKCKQLMIVKKNKDVEESKMLLIQ